ncbi:MAG TPA: Tol-Pal system beta propeller repeat protein TolB [Gammaproteobacteria bacterium]|nr:Tol-Pal system beta propeller repeat protein TolB [Gammaproteobacteria bacterium]
MFRRLLLLGLLVLLLPMGLARAALTIEITEGVEAALPIAIVPFGVEGGALPEDISAIVAADLRRSGRFAPLPEKDLLARPHEKAQINFADWRALGVDDLVIGKVAVTGPGQYAIQFQLFDVFRAAQLTGFRFTSGVAELRNVAHQISDIIYEKLTGERGAFATRIAYVTASPVVNKVRTYALQVADADGYNPQTIMTSKQPVLSPAWSPDGTRLSYVSFENRRAQIFIQDIASGRRELIASYPGLNGAPAWSPDGRRLALTLSKDGNPEIYVLNLASKALLRLTSNPAIDTEPTWSPDGGTLVFTSDRGGRPQLYKMPANGGNAQRVTFEGEYNARGVFSPNGEKLAMVQGQGNSYRIAVLDLKTNTMSILTTRTLDESPSFSPNGSMIIYATNDNVHGELAAVSVDGRVHQRLVLQEGDVREAVWSPFGRPLEVQPTQP